jgi:hypothetical protein
MRISWAKGFMISFPTRSRLGPVKSPFALYGLRVAGIFNALNKTEPKPFHLMFYD